MGIGVCGNTPAGAHDDEGVGMFTIKYTDQDGVERLTGGRDIRAVMDGKQARHVGWLSESGFGCGIAYPTTAYVMNESGATVAKYVVIGDQA